MGLISDRVDPSTGLLGSAGTVSPPPKNGPSNGMFNPKQFADQLGGGEGEAAGVAGGAEAASTAGGIESLAVLAAL